MANSRAIEMSGCALRVLASLVAVAVAAPAWAQTDVVGGEAGTASKRAWSIEPRISLTETYTDNANVGGSNKESDFITQVSPGVRIKGETARAKVNADYSLRGVMYANNSDENEIQHALNAFGTLEAVEDWLYLDASGVVTRQLVSALGTQSPDSSSINANSTQTSNFRLSPYIKGKLGGLVDYQARYSRSWANADVSNGYDTEVAEWSGNLKGDTSFARLGWSIDGSLQHYDYGSGRETESDRLRGFLTYRVDPQFSLSASLGRESNDFVSLQTESYTTHGYGFDWRPTERTEFSVFREKRFFGNGHNVKFKHRMRRSTIQFSDSRDVSGLPNQLTTVGLGSLYDLVAQLATSVTADPAEQSAFIDQFFAVNPGLSPDTLVTTDFLTSQVSLQHRQELSLLLSGVRNTVTLAVQRSRREGLSTLSGLGDDFDTYTDITQQGLSVSWSHRLTPKSSLAVTANYSKSSGTTTGGGEDDSTQKQLGVTYSTKLGARTSASLSARRTQFDSSISNDYTEHAVVGTLSMTF